MRRFFSESKITSRNDLIASASNISSFSFWQSPSVDPGNDWGMHSIKLPAQMGSNPQFWQIELQRAIKFTSLSEDWDGNGSLPLDLSTIMKAIQKLAPWMAMLPAPSFSPGSDGELWALWVVHGLDIEICFRPNGSVFSMLSDERRNLAEFSDDDMNLHNSSIFFNEMAKRIQEYKARNAPHESFGRVNESRFLVSYGLVSDLEVGGGSLIEPHIPRAVVSTSALAHTLVAA